jgi:hypothetical protein
MDVRIDTIAYIDTLSYVPSLGDLALSLELVGSSRGLHDVLSVDEDHISTAVGVL